MLHIYFKGGVVWCGVVWCGAVVPKRAKSRYSKLEIIMYEPNETLPHGLGPIHMVPAIHDLGTVWALSPMSHQRNDE